MHPKGIDRHASYPRRKIHFTLEMDWMTNWGILSYDRSGPVFDRSVSHHSTPFSPRGPADRRQRDIINLSANIQDFWKTSNPAAPDVDIEFGIH